MFLIESVVICIIEFMSHSDSDIFADDDDEAGGLNDSHMSVDESLMSESADDLRSENSRLKNRVAELEARNAQLEEFVRSLGSLGKLFTREKSKGSPTPTHEMDELLFNGLGNGGHASVVHGLVDQLALQFPVLLDQRLGGPADVRKVPNVSYVERFRNRFASINKAFIEDFVMKAQSLTIGADDSPSPDGRSTFCAVGAFNEKGEFACLGFIEKTGVKDNEKKGEGIRDTILNVLKGTGLYETIKAKLHKDGPSSMVSDTAANQKKANRLVVKELCGEEHSGESIGCLMHLG